MHLTRAFRHAGRFNSTLFASALLLATSCAHVRAQAQIPVLPNTTGEQKTAVILVNFQDNTAQSKTVAEANALVFGDVSDFYWESSYQKTFLSGDTFGWFTIPVSTSTCDIALIAGEADRAATAAGANLAAYAQVVYMWPANSGCTWGGLTGTSPSGQKRVFINGSVSMTLKTVAHEMGHGFGLMHANAWDCDANPVGGTCVVKYNYDVADTMGGDGHFNAFHKERLGWLNAAGTPPITTVNSSGRYAISPMETSGAGAKALKILKSIDPVSGQQTWYYVEYRQALGFDAPLGGFGNLTSGVLLHTGTVFNNSASSLLLDMTPNSASNTTDFRDSALAIGRSFTDPASGVTITLAAADASGATIDVSFGGSNPPPTCTRAAPTLSLGGPTTAVAAGSTISYTLSLSNKDSSACTATTFNLARSIPAGWTGTLAASTLSLSPGASGSTTLTVTSPASATAGGYGIGAGIGSSAGGVHAANASTTYSVANAPSSDTLTETIGTDKTSYVRAETVYMSALVKNNGVAANGASVKFNVTLPNGSVTVLSATSGSDGYARSNYKLGKGKGAIGGYALRADASSGSATAIASTNFSVR